MPRSFNGGEKSRLSRKTEDLGGSTEGRILLGRQIMNKEIKKLWKLWKGQLNKNCKNFKVSAEEEENGPQPSMKQG